MAQTSSTAANNELPVAVSPPTAALAQLSYSGTPRGPTGETTPDDYAREMADPIRRMEIFEEMRGSDHAVNSAIDARRQEINAANWVLATEDKSDLGTQILEFVEDNVYPVLDDLLRWLGEGGLQYGFGAVEPVYVWADRPVAGSITRGKIRRPARSNMRGIYLAKLAHLRQPSVQTFKISQTGDLEYVVQYAFNGATYRRVEIPGEKLLLWTYDRQGDDRWGVPPARHCVKAWTFKSQIEKLNLLHIDRFGVGLPVVEEGEGWSQADRDRMATFLKAWRSGGGNFLMHPSGGAITVVSDDGKTTLSMLEWVKYYDLAIAKTYLTQSSELGSTQTGSRAVGQTMVEQLGSLVQADCEELGSLINERLIKQLVDWNFGPQEFYPAFTPSARVRANSQLVAMAKPLYDIGMLHARPEDEVYVRDALELPSVDLGVLQQEQSTRDAAAAAAAEAAKAAADAAASQPADQSGNNNPSSTPTPLKIAASREHGHLHQLTLAEGAPAPAMRGTSYRTPDLTQWESGIVKPDVLVRDLDLATARTAGEVTDVLREIDENLATQAAALGAKGAAELAAGVRNMAVPDRLRRKLRAVLLDAAERARTYGTQAVHNEIQRQIGPEGIGPQRDGWYPSTMEAPSLYARMVAGIRALVAGSDEPSPRDVHLEAEVDRAVEEEIDRREGSVRSSILTALAQAAGATAAVLGTIVSTASKAALIGLSTGRTQANVQGVVNVGFGVGRSDAAEAIAAPAAGGAGGGRSGLKDSEGNDVGLIGKVYSAVMDLGTCDECAKWDGAEFPIDYPEDYTGVQAPNPRCSGGYSRCRCIWVYLTSKESIPLVPAAKGPEPVRQAFSAEDVNKAVREAVAEHAAKFAPSAPQPMQLHITVESPKAGATKKTIVGPNGTSYSVTEEVAP
jgi:hypothetical protein